MVQTILQNASPKTVQQSCDESVLRSRSGSEHFELKSMRESNPTGYMSSVLMAVRANPSESVDILMSAYDVPSDSGPEELAVALKALGHAGNMNPELMAELMDEMSSTNVLSQLSRLTSSLSLFGSSTPIEQFKDAMAGAMFTDSSLNFTLSFCDFPPAIQTL